MLPTTSTKIEICFDFVAKSVGIIELQYWKCLSFLTDSQTYYFSDQFPSLLQFIS